MMLASKIRAEMIDASIILLLLSSSYFRSPYCSLTELPFALALHEDGKAWVVPVLLRPVNWLMTEIKKYTVSPRNGIPVTSSSNKDEALAEITRDIDRVIDTLTLKGGSLVEAGLSAADDNEVFRCELICAPSIVVRSNGITELLPDLVLRFHGEPGDRRVADIVLTANTNITSRLLSGGITEATLSLSAGRCVTQMPTLSRGFR